MPSFPTYEELGLYTTTPQECLRLRNAKAQRSHKGMVELTGSLRPKRRVEDFHTLNK